jgi:hypothetical protein
MKGAKAGFSGFQMFGNLQEIARRAGQSVEPGNDDYISHPKVVQQAVEFRTSPLRARNFLLVNALATGAF